MMNRREFGSRVLWGALALAAAGFGAPPARAGQDRIEPELGEDGIYRQTWFLNSFLDLKDDLTEARDKGKRFAIIWEQKGCPYCRETHLVNFANPKINAYVRENFEILQLDLWGSRRVTDFDGEELEERALARKWRITYTPTIMFMDDSVEQVAGKSGAEAEVVRMPGYFKPFHFISMFEYVRDKAYRTTHFQRYIQDKADRMRAQGVDVSIW